MQIGTVARNLEAAIKPHFEKFAVGPWEIFEVDAGELGTFQYRGKPANFRFRIGMAWAGNTQLEIIQPVSGYSIYDEHLEKFGEGLHHMKYYYPDCQKVVDDYRSRGYPVIQSGQIDEDVHYYFDTTKDLGYILEIGNADRINLKGRCYPA